MVTYDTGGRFCERTNFIATPASTRVKSDAIRSSMSVWPSIDQTPATSDVSAHWTSPM